MTTLTEYINKNGNFNNLFSKITALNEQLNNNDKSLVDISVTKNSDNQLLDSLNKINQIKSQKTVHNVDKIALEADILQAMQGKLTDTIKMLVISELQDLLGEIVYLCPTIKETERIINQEKCLALTINELLTIAYQVKSGNKERVKAILLKKIFNGREIKI